MKKTIIITLALAGMLTALNASAQSFQEGFFLNGYRLGYRYNPAVTNEGDFLSLGEWSTSGRNNFGASSFLYPTASGKVVTALHASVSPDTFLGSLNEDNWFNKQINFNLAAYGFRKENAYHTIEANIRGLYSASIPIEIFEVVKRGTANVNYDLSGLRGGGQAYVELAYGYARELSDVVSVGARAKLLLGIESASYTVNRLDLTLNENVYKADISADMKICSIRI